MKSSNNSFRFWQKWLIAINCFGILTGLLFPFISTVDFISAGYNQALSEVFFGQKMLPEKVFGYNQWVWAMLGAVISGWSICMLFIVLFPFKKKEKWAWGCIGISLVLTFIVDIAFSIYFNFYTEIVIASSWFLPSIIPLMATYKYFFKEQEIN